MKKRAGFLLALPAVALLLGGCSLSVDAVKKSAKKHVDRGVALLEKGVDALDSATKIN